MVVRDKTSHEVIQDGVQRRGRERYDKRGVLYEHLYKGAS